MGKEQNDSMIKIGKKTFITAVIILGLLMITVGVLTKVIPAGSYERIITQGHETIQQGTFQFTEGTGFPVWRWFSAPIEVLWSSDGAVIIVIIFFLVAVAGAFALLESSGVMTLAITRVVDKFYHMKYLLMAIMVFIFMMLGAVLGTFEENIALVPMIIALSYCLGWDSLIGLGMSILASCFGFTSAITNPFSIAITQRIAGLPLYSGTGLRIIIFISYYVLVLIFLLRYARKIEKDPSKSLVYGQDGALRSKYSSRDSLELILGAKSKEELRKLKSAAYTFCIFLFFIFAMILTGTLLPSLSDLELPLIGLLFLVGGFISSGIAGIKAKERWVIFGKSAAGIAPGILLILMAMSVKYIITHGGIMDTILYYASNAISATSPYIAIIMIYALILLLELFVGSSSAKAFLVMPLIAPLSDLVGITRQTSVLAFCFGDGFSNVLYPTNPVLLICLGLTVVTYTKWIKWTYKLQLIAFALACAYLFLGVAIDFGPF